MRIDTGDGTMEAYRTPAPATPATGLVVLTPIFGLEPGMCDVIDEYAKRGYLVVAPDLFWRTQPGPFPRSGAGKEAARARKERTDPALALRDVAATVDATRALPECNGRVAVIGFCFGGRYAFLAAADLRVDAAVAFHPTEIGISLDAAPRVKVPLGLHFGDRDSLVPMSEVLSVERAVRAETFVYPGAGHGFAVPQTPSYDPVSASLAQARMFQLVESLS